MTTPSSDAFELDIPRESLLLKATYKKSGLTVADLATATGLSVGTIHIALSGIRYRDGQPRVAVPADRTLVRLASTLGIRPEALRAHDRDRAADLLAEASEAPETAVTASERDAQAAAAGRAALAKQVLAAFSAEDLRDELQRREQAERAEQEEVDRQVRDELVAELRQDAGQP